MFLNRFLQLPPVFRSLLLGCLFLVGCAPAPLGRPAILGASASAGFGCEMTGPDGQSYLVDMEAVYEATVPGWRARPVFLADAGFYSRPREAQAEQMNAALAANPSILVAVDYLFWSVYARRDQELTAEILEHDRHAALERALAELDRFRGPIIVGDLPNMRAAVGHMLSERNIPPQSQLDALNRCIADWAARRPPEGPAIIVPLAELAASIESRRPLRTSNELLSPDETAALVQADHLHPTPKGLALLLREGLSGLAARGTINRDSFRSELADIIAGLPAEARSVDGRREPGLWTLLAMKGKLSEFDGALKTRDCSRASELFDQIMEKVVRLKQSPHELAALYIYFSVGNYRRSCADASQSIQRWRDRLVPAIERPLPDPWPLTIWCEFNDSLGDDEQNVRRALRLKRQNPSLSTTYDDILRSAALAARYADPAVYLELLPSWEAELQRQCEIIRKSDEFWTNFAKGPQWPKEAEHNFQMAMSFAKDEGERERTRARRAEFDDPQATIVRARAPHLESIADLERALVVTDRSADASVVAGRLEQVAGPDEVATARERSKKRAASAASPNAPSATKP